MQRPLALGVSIGVPAGLWTAFALSVPEVAGYPAPFVVWIGFAAWAVCYAAGGRLPGLTRTLGSTLSGLLVALAAVGMCGQAVVPLPAFTPGASVGAAASSGSGVVFWATLVSLVAGALLAYASELLGDAVEKAVGRSRTPQPAPTTAPA